MHDSITFDDIVAARSRGRSVVTMTPTLPSPSFSRLSDHDVWLKAEHLQRTGSFKIRGAMNAIAMLPDNALAAGVVAASAGNHAQGVALAAREHTISATVFMPVSAAIPKIVATREYGATVILEGANLAEATDSAVAYAKDSGATLIHPFDDANVIAGQGTLGLELFEQTPDVDTVIVPVGGGGLISGTAFALKHLNPAIRIVGVQAEAVPTYVSARRTGNPREIVPGETISDGIAVSRPSPLCYDLIERYVDELVTVDDQVTTEAVALLLERAKYLVEPSGSVGIAALLAQAVVPDGKTVVVLTGGNIDLLLLDSVVRHGLAARGRFGSLTVTVLDEPGQLATLLAIIGDQRGNVLSVLHHREGPGLEFGKVDIQLTLETRSREHFNSIVETLRPYDVVATQPGLGRVSSS
jgi:threonine dehydratase